MNTCSSTNDIISFLFGSQNMYDSLGQMNLTVLDIIEQFYSTTADSNICSGRNSLRKQQTFSDLKGMSVTEISISNLGSLHGKSMLNRQLFCSVLPEITWETCPQFNTSQEVFSISEIMDRCELLPSQIAESKTEEKPYFAKKVRHSISKKSGKLLRRISSSSLFSSCMEIPSSRRTSVDIKDQE